MVTLERAGVLRLRARGRRERDWAGESLTSKRLRAGRATVESDSWNDCLSTVARKNIDSCTLVAQENGKKTKENSGVALFSCVREFKCSHIE